MGWYWLIETTNKRDKIGRVSRSDPGKCPAAGHPGWVDAGHVMPVARKPIFRLPREKPERYHRYTTTKQLGRYAPIVGTKETGAKEKLEKNPSTGYDAGARRAGKMRENSEPGSVPDSADMGKIRLRGIAT